MTLHRNSVIWWKNNNYFWTLRTYCCESKHRKAQISNRTAYVDRFDENTIYESIMDYIEVKTFCSLEFQLRTGAVGHEKRVFFRGLAGNWNVECTSWMLGRHNKTRSIATRDLEIWLFKGQGRVRRGLHCLHRFKVTKNAIMNLS